MFGLISLGMIIALIWIEVVMFGVVGGAIGVLPTIIGIFVTAAIGIRLFRSTGAATLQRMSGAVAQGKAPVGEIADGAAIILAATLLLIPGYATDALGFILFMPGLRTVLMGGLIALLLKISPQMSKRSFHFSSQHMGQNPQKDMNGEDNPFNQTKTNPLHDGDDASQVTIEGDYKRHDEKP